MSDTRVQETLEGIFKVVSPDLQRIEPTATLKLNSSIQNCFRKSGDNSDRFAQCMVDTQKRVQQLTEAFQFKQLFLTHSVQACLAKNNDVEKCKKEGINIFKNSINGFLGQLDKL